MLIYVICIPSIYIYIFPSNSQSQIIIPEKNLFNFLESFYCSEICRVVGRKAKVWEKEELSVTWKFWETTSKESQTCDKASSILAVWSTKRHMVSSNLLEECHLRCRHLHWARAEEDCDCHECSLCSQEVRKNPLWIWKLEFYNCVIFYIYKAVDFKMWCLTQKITKSWGL